MIPDQVCILRIDIVYNISKKGEVMQKVLISIPDTLLDRMKSVIPSRQRSKVLLQLLEDEVKRREAQLYQCARDVENDKALAAEMKEWDKTIANGIDDETW